MEEARRAAPGVVLVADPEPEGLRDLVRLLGQDHVVHSTTDPSSVPSLATRLLPDLVLLAPHASAEQAFGLCAEVRAQPSTSDVPVILIADSAEDELRGLDAGAVDFVTRPVAPPVLLLRVRNQIDMKRVRTRLAILAGTDPLTGLANRRSMDEALHREWWRLRRSNAPLSLLMIDIDHFKDYNDLYGHPSGDECLRQVAGVVAGLLSRAPDLAARYGGEEFCGILPETELEGAIAVAERVRAQVAALELSHPGAEAAPRVTVSIGVVTAHCSEIDTPEELVRRADERLYEAKKAGRNRIVSGGPGTPARARTFQ